MAARVLAGVTLPLRGLRPVNLRTDLIQMADLIELCFGATMTEAGRASLREMRMIGGSDWLSWLLYGADRALGGLEEGFVWVEDGRIVGNVSLSPANYPRSEGRGFIIANVAVHPNYRRHGLAQAMVLACLDLAQRKDGTFAILQVEASNEGARKLYEKVGFRAERAFIQWRHGPQISPLPRLSVTPTITLRQGGQWRSEYALAERIRPNSKGGMGWLRPLRIEEFRPSVLRAFSNATLMRNEEHWIVPAPLRPNAHEADVLASLRIASGFGSPKRLDLLVDPSQSGVLEEALIRHALRDPDGLRPLTIEHPADDEATNAALEKHLFQRQAHHVHMRVEL